MLSVITVSRVTSLSFAPGLAASVGRERDGVPDAGVAAGDIGRRRRVPRVDVVALRRRRAGDERR